MAASFASSAVLNWADQSRRLAIASRRASSRKGAFESNGRLRDELLNDTLFLIAGPALHSDVGGPIGNSTRPLAARMEGPSEFRSHANHAES